MVFPNLRFPGFEGGYEEKTLSNLGTFSGGGTPTSSNERFWNGDIPWISSSDLEENNIFKINISRFITQDAIEKSSTKLCKSPSVLIVSRVGVGKVAISLNDVCTSQDFTNISELKCNQLYLAFQLSKVMKKAANEVQGTSIKGISSSEIKSKKIYLPSIIEQEIISSFFEKIEERIQTQRKIIEQLETLMKGSCEKLFLQKIGFSNLEESWQIVKLEDIFDFYKGSLFSKNDILESGNLKCIHYGELFTIYNAVISKVISRTNTEGFKSKTGDLLMPSSDVTPLGLATASAVLEDNIVLGGDINILRPKLTVNSIFMSYLLNFEKKKIIELVSGTTVKHIYNKDLKQIKVCIPSLKEQTKIANFLSSIQEKIETEKQILEKLELQKKFLLANLFV